MFSAIRVGGLEGRVVDEQVALGEGVLGQETVGAGGIAYGLRTVPVARADRPAGGRAGARRVGHQLHQPRRHGDRGDVPPPRGPGHRHLRLAGGPRPPGRPGARGRPGHRVVRLRRAQPPRLAAWCARRRARPAAPAAGRPRRTGLLRGGQAVRRRLAAHARRHPQRVPALLLLHPGRRRRRPRSAAQPRCRPDRAAAALLRVGAARPRQRAGRVGVRAHRARGHLRRGEPRGRRRGSTATSRTSSRAATRRWRSRSCGPSPTTSARR